MNLSEELKALVRDIGDGAGRSAAQAGHLASSRTREDMLGNLLGLITEAATVRDLAADLYVRLTDWDGEE